jgi:hypothetical protein
MEYMKQGDSAIPSNVKPAKTKYTNLGQKKMPWKSEGSDAISYTMRCIRPDSRVKDRDSRLNSKRNETTNRHGMKQKMEKNPIS